jgi:hypothetical protein
MKLYILENSTNNMKIWALLLPALLLSAPALGDCLNANLSATLTSVYANTTWYNSTAYEECPFGCNALSGACNSSPFSPDMSVFYLLFPLISFILLYFTSLLKEEDWFMHIILIAAAMFFIVVPMGLLAESLPISGLYWLSLVIAIFVVFYYVIKIITRSTEMMSK